MGVDNICLYILDLDIGFSNIMRYYEKGNIKIDNI